MSPDADDDAPPPPAETADAAQPPSTTAAAKKRKKKPKKKAAPADGALPSSSSSSALAGLDRAAADAAWAAGLDALTSGDEGEMWVRLAGAGVHDARARKVG